MDIITKKEKDILQILADCVAKLDKAGLTAPSIIAVDDTGENVETRIFINQKTNDSIADEVGENENTNKVFVLELSYHLVKNMMSTDDDCIKMFERFLVWAKEDTKHNLKLQSETSVTDNTANHFPDPSKNTLH